MFYSIRIPITPNYYNLLIAIYKTNLLTHGSELYNLLIAWAMRYVLKYHIKYRKIVFKK